MTQQLQVTGVKELYRAYVEKLLKENPEYWTARNRNYFSIPHYYVYRYVQHKSGAMVPEEVITYGRFSNVLKVYFKIARARIIAGETFQLWNQIGSISARRVERDFRTEVNGKKKKRKIDFKATMERNEINPATGRRKPVYFDTPDYCRIGWNRPKSKKKIRKIKQYEFEPADGRGKGGFADDFRKALDSIPALRYQYEYHPFIN